MRFLTFLIPLFSLGQLTLSQYEALYNTQRTGLYNSDDTNINLDSILVRGPDANNKGWGYQSHYFLGPRLDAVVSFWEATGNATAFNDAKQAVDDHRASAVPITLGDNAGFLGWPSDNQCPGATGSLEERRCRGGTPLHEFFFSRYAMRFLADIHMSATLKASVEATYPGWFDAAVNFYKVNIFDKWLQNQDWGGAQFSAFYRNRTHIAMEAAEFCMYYYIVTEDLTALEILQNIAYAGMPNYPSGNADGSGPSDNFLGQLDITGSRYVWNSTWAGTTNPLVQDTNHWGHFISSIIAGYELGVEGYDLAMMQRMAATLDFVMVSYPNYEMKEFVDGTGRDESRPLTLFGAIALGQFDETMLDNFGNNMDANDSNQQLYAGRAYRAEYIIQNGRPLYPEHYIPVDGLFIGDSGGQLIVPSDFTTRRRSARAFLIAN